MREEHKMKLPVQALVVTRAGQIAGLGLVAWLFGCASVTSVARDTFLKSYTCPSGQLTVSPIEDGSFVRVVGCGHDEEYACQAGLVARNVDGQVNQGDPHCALRPRSAYEATDGSIHEAWGDAAQRDAAIASAIHDLPCQRASIVAIDELTLEGCGQRVTYRTAAQEIPWLGAVSWLATPPGHPRITAGSRYTLVGRIPISAVALPSASATAPSPAPTAR
jgi:hypothetical protein